MGEQLAATGLQVHGELHSTDASAIVRVPLYLAGTHTARSVTITEKLHLSLAKLIQVVTGDGYLFFDTDALASAVSVVLFVDGGAGEDTVSISGDRSLEFESGRVFTVANDSDNDGSYTSTGATYDSTTGNTTINVATASWSGVTSDGDITSTALLRTGSIIARGTYAANAGEMPTWSDDILREGRLGEGVFCLAPAGVVDANVTALIRKVITKSGPTGLIHDPTVV